MRQLLRRFARIGKLAEDAHVHLHMRGDGHGTGRNRAMGR
jgi:hypothetical protein